MSAAGCNASEIASQTLYNQSSVVKIPGFRPCGPTSLWCTCACSLPLIVRCKIHQAQRRRRMGESTGGSWFTITIRINREGKTVNWTRAGDVRGEKKRNDRAVAWLTWGGYVTYFLSFSHTIQCYSGTGLCPTVNVLRYHLASLIVPFPSVSGLPLSAPRASSVYSGPCIAGP